MHTHVYHIFIERLFERGRWGGARLWIRSRVAVTEHFESGRRKRPPGCAAVAVHALVGREPVIRRHHGPIRAVVPSQSLSGHERLSYTGKHGQKQIQRHLALRLLASRTQRVPHRRLHQRKPCRHEHPRVRNRQQVRNVKVYKHIWTYKWYGLATLFVTALNDDLSMPFFISGTLQLRARWLPHVLTFGTWLGNANRPSSSCWRPS